MPICTRSSTPLPRSYLYDERLNSVTDPLAREAYLRAKTACDNLGRMPANPAMLAGTLFPSLPPKAAYMERIVQDWVEAGLVFHYQAGSRWYIEICDNGATSKLVGNMTGESEYPPPPAEQVEKWKAKFACEWKPIERKSKRVRTGSNTFEQVGTCSHEGKGREVKRSKKKRTESEATHDAASRLVLPDFVPIDTWKDFVEMRVKSRKAMTDSAAKLVIENLRKVSGGRPELAKRILERSIEHGWLTVYELPEERGGEDDDNLSAEEFNRREHERLFGAKESDRKN